MVIYMRFSIFAAARSVPCRNYLQKKRRLLALGLAGLAGLVLALGLGWRGGLRLVLEVGLAGRLAASVGGWSRSAC